MLSATKFLICFYFCGIFLKYREEYRKSSEFFVPYFGLIRLKVRILDRNFIEQNELIVY